MGYYDAEIMVKDINPYNAKIFEDCWMYVGSLRNKESPLYFAPYFTRKGHNSGISMISRVVGVRTVKLADTRDVFEPATEEQRKRWHQGLRTLRKHAESSGFAHQLVRLYFLDRPIIFRPEPLSKKALNEAGITNGTLSQIPNGFSLRFDQLLTVS